MSESVVRPEKLKSVVRDSQVRPWIVLGVVLAILGAMWLGSKALFYAPGARAAPAVTEAPQMIVVTATPEPTPVVQFVTVTVPGPVVSVPVTVTVPGPVEYVRDVIEVPGPVVTVTVPVSVPVPVEPWRGLVVRSKTVALCVFGEGLTGIYLDGVGVADGCNAVWLPSPSTQVEITVTR